jgi:murein DD-endopeptidase MepM/ murein hydrolase activator NlpD
MGKSLQSGALIYACAGAFIGAFSTLQVPPASFATFPESPLASLTLSSLAYFTPDISPPEPDPATWADNMRGVLRATMGMAVQTVTVQPGDTLGDVLVKTGIDRATAHSVVEAVHSVYNPKRLQVGQELELSYDALGMDGDATPLAALNFEVDTGHSVAVNRADDGSFTAKEIVAKTHREYVRSEGTITNTLFESAVNQGLPTDTLTALVKLFSYDVDFQRDIQNGDKFSVMYERTATEDGRPVRNLAIRYASMTVAGTPLTFYAFRQDDGTYDYYNEKGEGVRKALLRTPVNGAKLTSNFGMRRHPILGYSLMHRGVDFGAPSGTPIMAAGDGVIEKRENSKSYGNYIRIRHGSDYSTAYGHMSRFAADIAVGKRVRQGQIIGYVGATGRATGPHLHFEVLRKTAQVNPITVKFPASQRLEGTTLAKFKQTRAQTDQMFTSLEGSDSLAMAGPEQKPVTGN